MAHRNIRLLQKDPIILLIITSQDMTHHNLFLAQNHQTLKFQKIEFFRQNQ